MARKGLGKGLDSLIPDFYNEDFDSNSTQSLEDILNEETPIEKLVEDDVNAEEDVESGDEKTEKQKEIPVEEPSKESKESDETSEELPGSEVSKNSVPSQEEIQIQENVEEVKEIVNKNPRITLWSSQSAAVFRYLRKTEPEFSISKEASKLIEEAVSKKYPEIWALFEED